MKNVKFAAAVLGLGLLLLITGCSGSTGRETAQSVLGAEEEANVSSDSNVEVTSEPDAGETGIAGNSEAAQTVSEISYDEILFADELELVYADQFSVLSSSEGYQKIRIEGVGEYLVVPENAPVPTDLPEGMGVIQQPLQQVYLAATSAMDMICALDALEQVSFSGAKQEDWYIEKAAAAMEDGSLVYAGKYSAPDYELLLSGSCSLAIESTMIFHNPEVKEQMERLGIPVLVEHSSYESHPLGRVEWIKLYGVLFGKSELAQKLFDEQMEKVEDILGRNGAPAANGSAADSGSTGSGNDQGDASNQAGNTGQTQTGQMDQTEDAGATLLYGEDTQTVAFFYITSNGSVNVRKGSDYISRIISLTGGEYVFADLEEDGNALSTMNMQMEAFYAGAKDADILIYNSAVDGELNSIEELLQKSSLLADFKAVQEGRVFCTGKNLFQESMGIADLMVDIHKIVQDSGTPEEELTYLHRLE